MASSSALRATASATQRATSSSVADPVVAGAGVAVAGVVSAVGSVSAGAPAEVSDGASTTTWAGCGRYSATTTCALVPPKPKPEMPATARPL